MADKPVIYWDYLELPNLLKLQGGLEGDDNQVSEDEMTFIIVHQVFELWFRLCIKELKHATDKMSQPTVDEELIPHIVHHLNRVNTILESAIKHFDLMETLTPQDFLMFREKLGTASGFQSFQLREMELLLGLENSEREKQGHGDPLIHIFETAKHSEFGNKVIRALNEAKNSTSLRDAVLKWLYRTPIHGSEPTNSDDEQIVNDFVKDYLSKIQTMNDKMMEGFDKKGDSEAIKMRFEQSLKLSADFLYANDVEETNKARIQRIRTAILFIESYRELPLLSWPRELIDSIVQLEEQIVIFRFRHARMVERIIGRRVGTGGSSGVDYLDETTKYRIFPELSTVRTMLLPKFNLPELKHLDFYLFTEKN